MRNLPRFWYDWAHWIDYETFAFQLLVKNDFEGLNFTCAKAAADTCACTFASVAPNDAGQCLLPGSLVVETLGYGGASEVLYGFIL